MEKLQSSINVNMNIEYILGEIYKHSVEKDNSIDEKMLNSYINLLRQFLIYSIRLGFIDENNFERIIERVKSIGYLEFINESYFKAHGTVVSIDNHIVFNDGNMKNETDRIIFAFHEFFHALTGLSSSLDVISALKWYSIDNISNDDLFGVSNIFMVQNGFRFVIDDCLAQEVAEMLAYKYLNQERPKDIKCTFGVLFGNLEFISNWTNDCFYRVFQESFRNLMRNDMNKFIKCCFDGDFNTEFFKDCKSIEERISLFFVFKNWFNIISSLYAYMNPKSCFTWGEDGTILSYPDEILEESYVVSLNSSLNYKKYVLERK